MFLFSFYWGRGRTKNNSLVKLACLVRVALSAISCSQAGCGLFVIVRALLSRARRASYGRSYSRSQIFSACGCFAQPPFSFPVQEILGQCYTNCLTRLLFLVRPRPQLKGKRKIRSGLRDYPLNVLAEKTPLYQPKMYVVSRL